MIWIVGQTPAASPPGLSASDIFYISLGFIFLTAIVTTVVTKWAKDKCLKFFRGYHVTVERIRGQAVWGTLKVFSSGIEIVYDHAFPDHRGRKKTSFLLYQQEVQEQTLSIFRYVGELSPAAKRERARQIHRTFNPGPLRRFGRHVRNVINTMRDAFGAAIGAAVGQYQKMNPANAILSTQGSQVTQIGQTLLSRFANAYEPLLEQYIGQPVILQVADPINSNVEITEYTGYLADYTQQFIAVFAVNHEVVETVTVTLPDVDHGDYLPPLPAPPAPGTPRIVLPPPVTTESCIEVRMDGRRMRLSNTNHRPMVLRRFEQEGRPAFEAGMTIPPNGWVDMPASLVKKAKLTFDVVNQIDVVAPRKYATVRNAGELVERRGLMDELQFGGLPVVPLLFGSHGEKQDVDEAQTPTPEERSRME